jgi:hypothetical protein
MSFSRRQQTQRSRRRYSRPAWLDQQCTRRAQQHAVQVLLLPIQQRPGHQRGFRRTCTWGRSLRSGAVFTLERTSVDGADPLRNGEEDLERGLHHAVSRTCRAAADAPEAVPEQSPFAADTLQDEAEVRPLSSLRGRRPRPSTHPHVTHKRKRQHCRAMFALWQGSTAGVLAVCTRCGVRRPQRQPQDRTGPSSGARSQAPLLAKGAGGHGGAQLCGDVCGGASGSVPETPEQARLQRRIRFAMHTSLVANVALLLAKIVAFALSRSKAVLASTADSFVDIASQAPSCSPLPQLRAPHRARDLSKCSHAHACARQSAYLPSCSVPAYPDRGQHGDAVRVERTDNAWLAPHALHGAGHDTARGGRRSSSHLQSTRWRARTRASRSAARGWRRSVRALHRLPHLNTQQRCCLIRPCTRPCAAPLSRPWRTQRRPDARVLSQLLPCHWATGKPCVVPLVEDRVCRPVSVVKGAPHTWGVRRALQASCRAP